jgi:predicted kinase
LNLLPVPVPPPLDWPALTERFEWIRAMVDCPQDPVHHAEGDVWIHVKMVCDALISLDEWGSLPEADRHVVFAAALLHDVAKPTCTRVEDGSITSRGHSRRGAIQARRILWECGADPELREQVCALVAHHQIPFHLIDRTDAERIVRRISQSTRCDLLTTLATADALGRSCDDQSGLITRIGLFAELTRMHECWNLPWAFPSPLSRFEYFRREDRDPHYEPHDQSRCEVILMSGLPGSGKDSWIEHYAPHFPQISLDQIRDEIGAEPTGNQGAVIQTAKERARALLRQGKGLVWNATNLSADIRGQLVDLFTRYHASVRIVYIETMRDNLFARNQDRARAVPRRAIEHMMDRWEVPNPIEAPYVEWWENGTAWRRLRIPSA